MEKVKKNAKLAVKESTELAGNVENGTVNILSFKNFKAKINKKETKKVKNDVKSAKKAVKSLQSEKKSIETSANEEEKDAQESRKSSKSLQSEKKSIESSANEEDPKLVESLSETSVMEGTLESPQPTTVQPTVASADPKANALLQVFWDLASLDAEERQSATLRLIQMLTERQTDHSTDGTEQLLKDQEQLSRAFHADVLYSFNRLLRGLSSSRDGARQGFSLALTELLASFFVPCVSTSLLVECLKKHTEIASGMKGIEERDMIYGRVFGYLAILESGALLSAQCSSEDAIRSTLQDILHFAKKKPFLREWALNVVVKIFSSETSSSSSSDELVQFAEQWLLGEKSPLLKMDVGPELFMAFLVLFSRNSVCIIMMDFLFCCNLVLKCLTF
jgi:chemotaxis protein histidine kinase CheA